MFEAAALFYGLIASFVMASASRNRREKRHNPPVVLLAGWLLMSFSGAIGLMLLGYAAVKTTGLLAV